ncbi:hypothetical protein LO80_09680 [Candidatus Francisella endociliophora]|uniref:Lipoprotein n=1 Tax=Candidatus Francisella endociliophora TaxID=653937 RepID=A0A097ERM3_9GAMM|nr:hypothetical protein [Francisella sp. FSC1006]AIT10214.1 hypothetical protein LO80_09680 [Francisella sp. FSC1006]
MKKIIAVILVSLIISSCSFWSKFTSDVTTIKIDYKKNILEVDNYNDRNFNIEIINKNAEDGKYYASEDIVVKKGSHKYKLIFNQISKKSVDVLMKYSQTNTMYIYSSVEQNAQLSNSVNITYKDHTDVKTELLPTKATVIFNSSLAPTFYKVLGTSITNRGGMSRSEISTALPISLSEKEVVIGGVSNTYSPKEINCSALNHNCDE